MMNKAIPTFVMLYLFTASSCQTGEKPTNDEKIKETEIKTEQNQNMETNIIKSEEEWKKELGPEKYHILREKGTERPGTGEYNNHFEKGFYICGGCGTELFSNEQKFDSHCGWPSFDGELGGGDRIKKVKDISFGMVRTEIVCAKCGGHLGHIFDDGPTDSGLRYCVNSLSLEFKAAEK